MDSTDLLFQSLVCTMVQHKMMWMATCAMMTMKRPFNTITDLETTDQSPSNGCFWTLTAQCCWREVAFPEKVLQHSGSNSSPVLQRYVSMYPFVQWRHEAMNQSFNPQHLARDKFPNAQIYSRVHVYIRTYVCTYVCILLLWSMYVHTACHNIRFRFYRTIVLPNNLFLSMNCKTSGKDWILHKITQQCT